VFLQSLPSEAFFESRSLSGSSGEGGPCKKLDELYECRAGGSDIPQGGIVSGTKFNANHIFVTVYKINTLQRRGPDVSPVAKLSRVQEQKQKLRRPIPLFSKKAGNLLI